MDWEFRVLDSIQKYFSGNFMDNIMPKISSLGKCWLNLDNIHYSYVII